MEVEHRWTLFHSGALAALVNGVNPASASQPLGVGQRPRPSLLASPRSNRFLRSSVLKIHEVKKSHEESAELNYDGVVLITQLLERHEREIAKTNKKTAKKDAEKSPV